MSPYIFSKRHITTKNPEAECLVDAYLQEQLSTFITLVLTASLISVLLYAISKVYQPVVDLSPVKELFELNLSTFSPEPLERLLFITGIISLPFLLTVTHMVTSRYIVSRFSKTLLPLLTNLLYPALLVLALSWLSLHHNAIVYTAIGFDLTPLRFIFLLLVSYFFYTLVTDANRINIQKLTYNLTSSAFSGFAILSIFLVGFYGIMTLQTIEYTPLYVSSFNAVFHAVVQVFLGKELLVDLSHQYGLYPHIIEPVMKISGLSVLSFSILMSALNLVSVICIYCFMNCSIKSRIISATAFISLLYYCYFFGRVIDSQEYYYQYHPVRFLFPALSILLSYLYLRSQSRRLYYLSFFLYSVAMIWNFDSGFVLFLSWLLLLAYSEVTNLRFKRIFNHLITGFLVASIVLLCFGLYLKFRYGHFPNLAWAFDYQKLFYLYGYYMLPMKMWHPWMLVIFIYAASLLESLKCLMRKESDVRSSMFFFLSILGIGLFSYYQGRSHDLNLPGASYPAIIILAMYVDGLVERIKTYGLISDKICLNILLFVLLYINVSFTCSFPEITSTIKARIMPIFISKQSQISREFDFIRSNTRPGEELLVLTQLSGVHSLAAQSPCPLRIPGTTELILKSDYLAISDYLEKKAVKVMTDRHYAKFVNKHGKNLQVSAMNPEKTIFIFTKN